MPNTVLVTARRIALVLMALLPVPFGAWAQDSWPNRPIKIVVPFPPGGTSDQVARLLATPASITLKQPLIIENRAGSNGIPGSQVVANAAADGYTIALFPSGHAINGSLHKLSYDAQKSFTPLILVGAVPLLAVVSANSRIRNFNELVTEARRAPGRISYKSGGVGGSDHLATELLARTLDIKMLSVPYKGDPPAAMDLVAGQIDFGMFNVTSVIQLVKTDKMRALGIASAQRLPLLPQVATLEEQGVRGYTAGSWHALFGPANLSPEVVRGLNGALDGAIARPEITSQLRELGFSIEGGPPQKLERFLAAEIAKWAKVIREAGIKPED